MESFEKHIYVTECVYHKSEHLWGLVVYKITWYKCGTYLYIYTVNHMDSHMDINHINGVFIAIILWKEEVATMSRRLTYLGSAVSVK